MCYNPQTGQPVQGMTPNNLTAGTPYTGGANFINTRLSSKSLVPGARTPLPTQSFMPATRSLVPSTAQSQPDPSLLVPNNFPQPQLGPVSMNAGSAPGANFTTGPSPEISSTSDISGVSSTPTVNIDLNNKLPAGMHNLAPMFQQYGKQYGVDPNLLAAISMHETGNGTSRAYRQGNNAMGISNSNGPIAFNNVEDSIAHQARTLGTSGMYSKFRQTKNLADLGAVYAPVGAENDPYKQNGDWVNGVGKFYKQLNGS